MTTVVAFKRKEETVIAWDGLVSVGTEKYRDFMRKSMLFKDKNRNPWVACWSGDSSVGELMADGAREALEHPSHGIGAIPDFVFERIKPKVKFNDSPGGHLSVDADLILSDSKDLYLVSGDFVFCKTDLYFIGSGSRVARGVYEALKDTKIDNLNLLKKMFKIANKVDLYTSKEFCTNLTVLRGIDTWAKLTHQNGVKK